MLRNSRKIIFSAFVMIGVLVALLLGPSWWFSFNKNLQFVRLNRLAQAPRPASMEARHAEEFSYLPCQARALFLQGDYPSAIEVFDTLPPPEINQLDIFFKGLAYYKLDLRTEALSTWKSLDKDTFPFYLLHLAKAAEESSDPALMIRYANDALSLNPELGEAYDLLGKGLNMLDEPEQALSAFGRALQFTKPGTLQGSIYRSMARIQKEAGDLDSALENFTKAVLVTPIDNSYYLRLDLGDLYLQMNEFGRAEEQYEKAIAINPTRVDGFIRLGDLYFNQDEFERAEENYRQAIQIDPTSGRGEYALGRYYTKRGDYDNAVTFIERAIKLGWDYRWVWSDLGKAYKSKGDTEKALMAFTHIVENEKTYGISKDSWIEVAKIYELQGNQEEANRAWRKVLSIDPDNKLAQEKLGINP